MNTTFKKFTETKEPKKGSARRTVQADKSLSTSINRFVKTKKLIDLLQEELTKQERTIKERGEAEIIAMLEAKSGVESVIMASTTNALLFTAKNQFVKLDKKRYDEARQLFGEKYLSVNTSYTFNNEVLAKHQKEIAKAIQQMNIPDEDKAKLLIANTAYDYGFGIDEIPEVASKANLKISQVYNFVRPIQQLRETKPNE